MPTDPAHLYQAAYAKAYDANWEALSGGDSTDSMLSLINEALDGEASGAWLDIGCGSGRLLEQVGKAGYDGLYGLDCVPANVELARSIVPHAQLTLGTAPYEVSAAEIVNDTQMQVVSALGCTLGCFEEVQDLKGMFTLIAACLQSGGVWIADINTTQGMEANDGEGHGFTGSYGGLIIQIQYEAALQRARWAVTGFTPDTDGRFIKYQETHYQKAWDIHVIRAAAVSAGLSFEAMDAETLGPVEEESWQVLMMGRKGVA